MSMWLKNTILNSSRQTLLQVYCRVTTGTGLKSELKNQIGEPDIIMPIRRMVNIRMSQEVQSDINPCFAIHWYWTDKIVCNSASTFTVDVRCTNNVDVMNMFNSFPLKPVNVPRCLKCRLLNIRFICQNYAWSLYDTLCRIICAKLTAFLGLLWAA